MKKNLLLLLSGVIILLHSCQGTKATRGDAEFTQFSANFIDSLWKYNPNWATGLGYHNYDSVLTINDKATFEANLDFSKRYLDSLEQFHLDSLTTSHKTDFLLIQNYLKSQQFYSNELKAHEWDPSSYNFGSTLFEITQNKHASPAQIISNLDKFLSRTKEYYAVAKSNIKAPTKEHTDLAIAQLQGTIDMLQSGEIKKFYTANKEDTSTLARSVVDIKDFITYLTALKNDMESGKLKPKSFRLGKELFAKKFDYEIQSSKSAEEMYKIATARKKSLQGEMYQIATRLWSKYLPNTEMEKDTLLRIRKVIESVSLSHCKRENFQSEIAREIPILTQFIAEKDLVTMDPTKPLEVRKEPEWMAGVAGASISSPGPYDKEGKTYYNVGSLAAYTPEAAESFLREYNQYTLQVLNIHEAIPGHYVQLIHANKSPSLIQTIFQNGAFVEGWALYAERMMMESGWDKNTTINKVVSSDEMWLMYYKFHLRGVCNTILDYSIHSLDMSKEVAMDLMMKEAFQETSEAEGKWKRATLSQVQLCSYFTGFNEIYSFREKIKKDNPSFNLKAFNDKLLSFGSPPMKYLEEMFMKK